MQEEIDAVNVQRFEGKEVTDLGGKSISELLGGESDE